MHHNARFKSHFEKKPDGYALVNVCWLSQQVPWKDYMRMKQTDIDYPWTVTHQSQQCYAYSILLYFKLWENWSSIHLLMQRTWPSKAETTHYIFCSMNAMHACAISSIVCRIYLMTQKKLTESHARGCWNLLCLLLQTLLVHTSTSILKCKYVVCGTYIFLCTQLIMQL